MKKLILTLLVCIGSLVVSAQESDYSWMENAPTKYSTKWSQVVSSDASPCNKGTEPFKVFVKKFRSDRTFCLSRIRVGGDWDAAARSMEYSDMKANPGKTTRCETYFATYFGITADQVCFMSTYEDRCGEDGGGSGFYRFRRIDGKWYLTDMVQFG